MRVFRSINIFLLELLFLLGSCACDNGPGSSNGDATVTDAEPSDAQVYVPTIVVARESEAGCTDEGPGTDEQPLCTIGEGLARAQAGDVVLVREGVYEERLRFERSGLADQPIVLMGERGQDGAWLSVVEAGEVVEGWVLDTTKQHGVYMHTSVGFEPFALTANGYDIPRLSWAPGTEYDGYNYIDLPPDHIVTTTYELIDVNYWDGIEALYYHDAGTVYLRFRDGDDPNTKQIRLAPEGAGILIDEQSYIVVRDLAVRGAQHAIAISGSGAHDNTIEANLLTTGQKRVHLCCGASENHIRGNIMYMNGLGSYVPGAWGRGHLADDPYPYGVKEHIYNVYKHEVGRSTYSPYDDCGIVISDVGAGNEIYENTIFNNLSSIDIQEAPLGLRVYNNTLYGCSSGAIGVTGSNVNDAEIFGNLVYDANINFRMQNMEAGGRTVYLYNNRFFNPPEIGSHVYFHYGDETSTPTSYPVVWYYHNSLAGGYGGLMFSPWCEGNGGSPNTYLVNNVVSTINGLNEAFNLGFCDYNWFGGRALTYSGESWFGEHNILAVDEQLWEGPAIPDFALPAGHAAQEAGIDVSQPFVLGAETHPALPGFSPGYYSGSAPDLGVVGAP